MDDDKGMYNRLWSPVGPPSYTLHTYYGGKFDTVEGKKIYIGNKYIRPRWPIHFKFTDLVAHLEMVKQYKSGDDIYYLPPFASFEDELMKIETEADVRRLKNEQSGMESIILLVVDNTPGLPIGMIFDEWEKDSIRDKELQNPDSRSFMLYRTNVDIDARDAEKNDDDDDDSETKNDEAKKMNDEAEQILVDENVYEIDSEYEENAGGTKQSGNENANNACNEDVVVKDVDAEIEDADASSEEVDESDVDESDDSNQILNDLELWKKVAEFEVMADSAPPISKDEDAAEDADEESEGSCWEPPDDYDLSSSLSTSVDAEIETEDDCEVRQQIGRLSPAHEDNTAHKIDSGSDKEDGYTSDVLRTPIGSDNEGTNEGNFPVFNEDSDLVQEPSIGMKFRTMEAFRRCIRTWSIDNGYEIGWKKNDSDRATVICKQGCHWRCYCSKVSGEATFQIKTLIGRHVCCRTHSSKQMKVDWIIRRYMGKFLVDPKLSWKVIEEDIKSYCGMEVTKYKIEKARTKAIEKIHGENAKQFQRLRDYAEALVKYNPHSTSIIHVDPIGPSLHPTFQRFYVSYTAMHKGFLRACRPFICLDGCHLKGTAGGQLLSAVTRDANNALFPIAFAWVEAETRSSWQWFLEILASDIGTESKWTIMSDRQKGLMPAIDDVFPGSEHRSCVRHIWGNMQSNRWKGKAIKDALWGAAGSYNRVDHEYYMEELKKAKFEAWEYVSGIRLDSWARSHFQTFSKTDLIVSNIAESLNNKIRNFRDKPIITFFEELRWMFMLEFEKRRVKMRKYTGAICPVIKRKLDKVAIHARDEIVGCAGMGIYETRNPHGRTCIVKLNDKTCSCGKWQLSGLPCSHAYASILQHRDEVVNYVHPYYSKEAYMDTYADIIHPIPDAAEWTASICWPLNPPEFRNAPGRPKKKRTRPSWEPDATKLKKTGLEQHCSRCNQAGHNARSCGKETRRSRRMKRQQRRGQQMRNASTAEASTAEASTTEASTARASTAHASTAHASTAHASTARASTAGACTHPAGPPTHASTKGKEKMTN